MRTCEVEACDRKHQANGYCDSHNRYQKRTGRTPSGPVASRRKEPRWEMTATAIGDKELAVEIWADGITRRHYRICNKCGAGMKVTAYTKPMGDSTMTVTSYTSECSKENHDEQRNQGQV